MRMGKARALIEQSLYPIGLSTIPNVNSANVIAFELAYSKSMETSRWEELEKPELVRQLYDDHTRAVTDVCDRIVARRTASGAPQAFANLMHFFSTVIRPIKTWVTAAGKDCAARIFLKLNKAAFGMMGAFTDAQLGLIGPKSRRFVEDAFGTTTCDAARRVKDYANLAKWGMVVTTDGDLPTKRARK